MRKVSLILFLFACFALLTVPANIALADDIEKLERTLEYLKAKQVLDLEQEILTAKIQKLEDDYSDVIEPKSVTEKSSQTESPQGVEAKAELSEQDLELELLRSRLEELEKPTADGTPGAGNYRKGSAGF